MCLEIVIKGLPNDVNLSCFIKVRGWIISWLQNAPHISGTDFMMLIPEIAKQRKVFGFTSLFLLQY